MKSYQNKEILIKNKMIQKKKYLILIMKIVLSKIKHFQNQKQVINILLDRVKDIVDLKNNKIKKMKKYYLKKMIQCKILIQIVMNK